MFRRTVPHPFELALRIVDAAELEERAPQSDARREVFRMEFQAFAAGVDGVAPETETPVLFGQLRKGERGRVPLDPSPQVVDARAVSHDGLWYRD
jgi:hypothetical protein